MDKNSKIYVAGSTGLVGSAMVKTLKEQGYSNLITKRIDLTKESETKNFFKYNKPEYVFLCAAKVGGILANNNLPVDFFENNIKIQNNCIKYAYENQVKKLIFLGSSCIYPSNLTRPILESDLMSGPLESTNSAYAVAKIAGIELLKAYKKQFGFESVAVMPCNLYGPNDNFDLNNSHVLPALIRKFHEAKINNKSNVDCWGTGKPKREFLYSEDLAEACILLINNKTDDLIINVGYGEDLQISELSDMVSKVVGFKGNIKWDHSKPDGTFRKLIDSSKIKALGWKPKHNIRDGIEKAYSWFLGNQCSD